MSQIKIIENTSEIGAGTRGSSLGIGALKVAAHNLNNEYFGRFERFEVETENDLLNEPTSFEHGKRIDGMVNIYQRVADVVKHVLAEGNFPLILAGDHSSAGGTIAGFKSHFAEKRVGVVWVDAHADLHTPYTTPSGNIHGMPLATAVGTDNLECKVNEPAADTVDHWEQLKNLGDISPKILPEDIVFIGVRSTEKPEDEFIARNGVLNITVDEVKSAGTAATFDRVSERLSDCDVVYISFDVDSMDCDLVSMGTGTPVPNGLTPDETKAIMNDLASWEKVQCIEVVEINPCLDNKVNKMAETAFNILESFTDKIESRLS